MKRASRSEPKRHGKGKKSSSNPAQVSYSAFDRKLVLGDGDFTFSLGLVEHLRSRVRELAAKAEQGQRKGKNKKDAGLSTPLNLVATSLDSREEVCQKYENAEGILAQLTDRNIAAQNVVVAHGIDATKLAESLKAQKVPFQGKHAFARIIWNFPHSGQQRVHVNRELLSQFFTNATECLAPGGQIHVTVKLKPPYSNWGITELGEGAGLDFMGSLVFQPSDFPGYAHRTTDPTAKDVEIDVIRTLVFMAPKRKESAPVSSDSKDTKTTPVPTEATRSPGTLSKNQLKKRRKQMKKAEELQAAKEHHDQSVVVAAEKAVDRYSFFQSLEVGTRDDASQSDGDEDGGKGGTELDWLREDLNVLSRCFGDSKTYDDQAAAQPVKQTHDVGDVLPSEPVAHSLASKKRKAKEEKLHKSGKSASDKTDEKERKMKKAKKDKRNKQTKEETEEEDEVAGTKQKAEQVEQKRKKEKKQKKQKNFETQEDKVEEEVETLQPMETKRKKQKKKDKKETANEKEEDRKLENESTEEKADAIEKKHKKHKKYKNKKLENGKRKHDQVVDTAPLTSAETPISEDSGKKKKRKK